MSIEQKEFGDVMTLNMKDYAEEVNSERAIPDIRDGLKPAQRKILYWLSENKGVNQYRGCAEISGGTTGCYHPHSDDAIYGALARLSQPLILNYPLIDFHGNNGSLTDPPAAKRYTKAKLSEYGIALLKDIKVPEMVEWKSNYNETLYEPRYLLGTLGTLNLLINPQLGIGVAVTSHFTCHNIEDVKRVLEYRMEHPTCRFEDLPEIHPSFHNGGVLVNKEAVKSIYKTGKGTITLRGRYHWDDRVLYITEFPYRVNSVIMRKKLIEHPIEGISEVYEQDGILKIYIEPTAEKETIEFLLLKKTPLQSSYTINMMATDFKGKPRLWTLLEILDVHIAMQHHRLTKIAKHKYEELKAKIHIDEGIVAALSNIDLAIQIIKESSNSFVAQRGLMETFSIDEKQAKAILDIKLSRLTKMEVSSIENSIVEMREEAARNKEIMENKALRENIYKEEISSFSDPSPRTECLDLIKAEGEKEKITERGFIRIAEDELEIHREETLFNGDEQHFAIDPEDEYIFITNELRQFGKKGKDFFLGTHSYGELFKLHEGEKVIQFVNLTEAKKKYSYVSFFAENLQKNLFFHISFLRLSPRGKKIGNKKYCAKQVELCIDKPEGTMI